MKIVYVFCLLLFSATIAKAQVKVIGSVEPNAASDKYPTHSDIYGKGGFRAVADITERNAITPARRSEGMLVFCVGDGKFYQLKGGLLDANWIEITIGGGGGGTTADATTLAKGVIKLAGDLSGTADLPLVAAIGGIPVSQVVTGMGILSEATDQNALSTLVKRDASGNFSANMIMANITGNLTGTATISSGSVDGTVVGGTTPAAGSFTSLIASSGLSVTGNIVATGNVTANSDRRLKTHIKTLPSVSQSLRQINPVSFDRTDMSLHQWGFIAQNVQQYFPALVTTGSDKQKTLSLNYQAMTAPLLKGWQEHDQQIDSLQNEVKALKKELEELKQLIKKGKR
jgi:hypothetical protein